MWSSNRKSLKLRVGSLLHGIRHQILPDLTISLCHFFGVCLVRSELFEILPAWRRAGQERVKSGSRYSDVKGLLAMFDSGLQEQNIQVQTITFTLSTHESLFHLDGHVVKFSYLTDSL